MPTLTARGAGEEHAGMKLIKETIPNNTDRIIKVGNYGNGHHAKDISDENGIMPTICCGNHGKGQTILTSSPSTAKENYGGGQLKRYKNYVSWKNLKGDFNTECNRASLPNDLCLTIATCNVPKVVEDEQSISRNNNVKHPKTKK